MSACMERSGNVQWWLHMHRGRVPTFLGNRLSDIRYWYWRIRWNPKGTDSP